jgi:hypothetical protein
LKEQAEHLRIALPSVFEGILKWNPSLHTSQFIVLLCQRLLHEHFLTSGSSALASRETAIINLKPDNMPGLLFPAAVTLLMLKLCVDCAQSNQPK